MKKSRTKLPEETQLNEDIEAFEEWEKQEGAALSKPLKEELKPAEEDVEIPDDLAGFNDPEPAAPVKKAQVGQMADEPADEGKTAAAVLADELAELSPDIPINLVAVIGKTAMSVAELIKYRMGQVIDLKRAPGETVDLVANGRLIARGELVEMDGKLGVRILKMVR